MLTYEHVRQKNLNLKGFLVNQNVSDGYELTNLEHQIFGLTGRKVFGAIPYNHSFTIESYVENLQILLIYQNLVLKIYSLFIFFVLIKFLASFKNLPKDSFSVMYVDCGISI